MSVQKLPSGRWRAQVSHDGRNVSVTKVLDDEELRELGAEGGTFATKTAAKTARGAAREKLRRQAALMSVVTVGAFFETWTTDRLFARPKKSTMIHNAERVKAFVEAHKDRPIASIGDLDAARWLAGGKRNGQVPALRAMWNDAMSAKAGRLTRVNPWAGLGISRTTGNKDRQPPTVEQMETMLLIARDLTPPSFADYLEMACVTAMRPGELDAFRPEWVRAADREIDVLEQWNARVREFTAPKYGRYTIALVARAETVLGRTPAYSTEFVFTTERGTHYTPSSRVHHWNKVRAGAGLPKEMTLYLATRHYFGWYAVNVLELDTAIVAEQLGHKDGGKLVEALYGHPDKARRRRLVREAHDAAQERERLEARKRARRGLRAVDGGAS